MRLLFVTTPTVQWPPPDIAMSCRRIWNTGYGTQDILDAPQPVQLVIEFVNYFSIFINLIIYEH